MSSLLNDFEDACFQKANQSFRQSSRTAFRRSVPSFEDEVAERLLNFESAQSKGIKVVALREGEYRIQLPFGLTAQELLEVLKQDNPEIDLTFYPTYGVFKPETSLIKHSSVPLWIVSNSDTKGVVRISRCWSGN